MSSSTTTNVGIRLSLEGAQQVESGLGRVQTMAGGAAKALAGIAAGSISIAGLTAFVKGAIDAADETAKVAQKTGLAAEQVAGLRLAFEQSGGAVDQFVPIMAKLSVAVVNGNKALDAMGISSKNADGSLKSVRQVLGEVSNQFAGYEDGARKTALAVALLGEEGAKMLPFLNQGAAALDEYDRIARQLGLTLDQETVAQAEKFNDTLDLIGRSAKGVATQIAAQMLPTLNTMAGELLAVATDGQTLDKVVKVLGNSFKALYSVGVGVVEVFKTVGTAVGGVSAAIVAALSGDFSAARNIVNELAGDISKSWAEAGASINRVWADGGNQTIETMAKLTRAARDQAPVVEQAAKASTVKAKADREAAEALKARVAAQVSANAAFDEEFKRIEDIRLAGEARIQSAREMLESIQRETALLGLSNLEKEKSIALWELERQGVVAGTEAYDAFAGKIGAAIEARNARQQQLDQEKAAIDQAKAAANEWQKTSDNIERSLTDALMRGFENGKSFGENLGDSVSNYFKTTVAEAIASAITKAIMSALASTEWGRFFSSVLGGGGGGNLGTSLLSSAAQNYMTGGSALGASGNAVGAWATGSMSTANMAGSIYANYTGAGIDGLLATNGAYGTAASGSAAGASSATWISAVGYAALIAAAVVVAENLYSKGYTRTAVGKGPGETNRFGYTSFTSDPNMGNSTAYNISPENRTRMIFDSLGMSEKWADIFSGTTRMGTLFGRKLGAYGYEAQIAGGDAEVGGFARYKGGLFRSNKTVGIEIDERDAANIDAMVEAQIEGSRNMAKAMGLSSEAIDAYTGSIKINMKGAKTAEEQAERAAKAMDDLNYELIKTASGGKLAREDFKQFMEGIQQDIQQAGISAAGIADIMLAGMTGRLSGADVGAQLSDMILGGIYDAIAGSAAAQISQLFMTQIITPIFTAIASGVPVSQAVSAAAMKQTVETARQYMATVSAIFNDPEFQAWVAEFKGELNRLGGDAARVAAPSMRTYGPSPAQLAAEETKRERDQLELELLRLQGNTVELRKRELAALKPVNRALQEQIWALEDVNNLKDAWTGLTDSIEEEIKRLRGVVLGESSAGLAYLQAQFATTTAQARAMDQAAAGRLPELSGQLAELYLNSSTSASDYQARINSLAASLEETKRITRSTAGITADGTQKVKDEQTQQQIKLLQQSIEVLTATLQEGNKSAAITASALNKASTPAGLRTVPA